MVAKKQAYGLNLKTYISAEADQTYRALIFRTQDTALLYYLALVVTACGLNPS